MSARLAAVALRREQNYALIKQLDQLRTQLRQVGRLDLAAQLAPTIEAVWTIDMHDRNEESDLEEQLQEQAED